MGAGFEQVEAPGVWRLEAPDARALNDKLDHARKGGALIVSLTREARDLEGVLADAVGVAA